MASDRSDEEAATRRPSGSSSVNRRSKASAVNVGGTKKRKLAETSIDIEASDTDSSDIVEVHVPDPWLYTILVWFTFITHEKPPAASSTKASLSIRAICVASSPESGLEIIS